MIGSGSREVKRRDRIFDTLDVLSKIMTYDKFHLGDARGADAIMIDYCKERDIEYDVTKAEWEKHGKAAGPIRNKAMIEKAVEEAMLKESKVCLVAFPHNDPTIKSKGTWDTIQKVRDHNTIKIFVFPME